MNGTWNHLRKICYKIGNDSRFTFRKINLSKSESGNLTRYIHFTPTRADYYGKLYKYKVWILEEDGPPEDMRVTATKNPGWALLLYCSGETYFHVRIQTARIDLKVHNLHCKDALYLWDAKSVRFCTNDWYSK